MNHRTNGLFHHTTLCFAPDSPICVGATSVFSSLGQALDAWPTTLPSSVSPNHPIPPSFLPSDASTTRIYLPGERILPVHAPYVLLHSEQVPFLVPTQPLISAHWRKKKQNGSPTPTRTSSIHPHFYQHSRSECTASRDHNSRRAAVGPSGWSKLLYGRRYALHVTLHRVKPTAGR